MPSELASAMAKKQLFGLYVPKELGGPEADPITAFRVVEEIAQVDGSVGWCVFNGTAVSSAVARLSPRAAKELFGDPPLVLSSGSARSRGHRETYRGGVHRHGPVEFPQRDRPLGCPVSGLPRHR